MFCDQTEEFLRENGVEFAVRNVAEDDGAMAELQRMGTMTTPVTVVGNEVVVGFDRARLRQVLGL
ncbi:MAG: glutaredoxin family protein [Rubrobacter sp.]